MNESKENSSVYAISILFTFSFLTASTYVFVRALAVSLFIARAGSDKLPVALGISALFVIVVSALTKFGG